MTDLFSPVQTCTTNITKSQSQLQQSIAPYVMASCPPAAAAQPPPLVAALYRRGALWPMVCPWPGRSWLRSWWRRSQILASYYLPPADSAKAEAALVLKLCCIRRIILKQNKKKNPWSDELYRPPNIYDIHTYNTQNYYYQQNTWSKPPLLPRLTLTEAEVFLCEEQKKERKQTRSNFL
jgi:hypothetical protein